MPTIAIKLSPDELADLGKTFRRRI